MDSKKNKLFKFLVNDLAIEFKSFFQENFSVRCWIQPGGEFYVDAANMKMEQYLAALNMATGYQRAFIDVAGKESLQNLLGDCVLAS
jgi:hypothetical protein